MIKIAFYNTVGCHLCDDAELLLNLYETTSIENKSELDVYRVDIAKSDELMELYGVRIPVLKRLDTEVELGWPFELSELSSFLS